MGVGAVDAVVEVALVGDEFDFYGPDDDSQPAELLKAPIRRTVRRDDDYETSDEDEYEDDLEESDGPDAERLRRFLARVLKEMGLWPRSA